MKDFHMDSKYYLVKNEIVSSFAGRRVKIHKGFAGTFIIASFFLSLCKLRMF